MVNPTDIPKPRRPPRAPPAPTPKHSLFPASIAASITQSCGRLSPAFADDVSRVPGKTTVFLPERADSPFELEEAHTGVRLSARLVGARSVTSEVSQGYVVYRDALPNGVDIIHVPTPTGTEDLLTISGPETNSVSYNVELGAKIAGLRLFANTLEFVDSEGMPRLRVSPPYLLDANLKRYDATLTLTGCTADTSVAPPWAHAVHAPGAKSCTLVVSWKDATLAHPALLDPSWSSTASLATARSGHVAGLLGDGTVLVAGGSTAQSLLASAERFRLQADGTGAWAAAAPMKTSRLYALSAAQPNRFYVINGYDNYFCTNRGSAEFFSTSTNDWTFTGPEVSPFRFRDQNGTATLLADGRILVVGGDSCDDGLPQNWVDIYDPLLDRWTSGPDLPAPRGEHAAVRAADGRVLVVGGREAVDYYNPDFVAPTFLFDPNQNQWFNGPPLNHGRIYHGIASLSATSLDVLVFGGWGDDFASPTLRWTGGSSFRTLPPGSGRSWDLETGWTVLRDGSVLGVWGFYGTYRDAEIFNPSTEQWSSTGAVAAVSRFEFTVTDLGTKALVAGGADSISGVPRAQADLYTYATSPPSSQFCGDGIRDPVREECDLGDAVPVRDLCSTDCRVRDRLALAQPPSDAATLPTRTLGEGRHPVAITASGAIGIVLVEPEAKPLRLSMTTYSPEGIASDVAIPISTGSMPLMGSHPVIASLPSGKFAVAYTDFQGDGDKLGVALRMVDPPNAPTGSPAHANTTTVFSQYDPDLIATSTGLVVAWVDDANAASAPDIKYRTFGFDLMPTSGEQALATTVASEGNVALAPWGTGWAAAWRAGVSGVESIEIQSGSTHWSVGPFLPGPSDVRPALAELDATHLLVVYAEGFDPAETGVSNDSHLRAAVLDLAAPGTAAAFDVPAMVPEAAGLSQDQPNAMRVGNRVFIAWRTSAAPGNANGENLWLKEVTWNGTSLDLGITEIALPRLPTHRTGNQRRPALAAGSLAPPVNNSSPRSTISGSSSVPAREAAT